MSGGDHTVFDCGCVHRDEGRNDPCDRHRPPPDHDEWKRLRAYSNRVMRAVLDRRRRKDTSP